MWQCETFNQSINSSHPNVNFVLGLGRDGDRLTETLAKTFVNVERADLQANYPAFLELGTWLNFSGDRECDGRFLAIAMIADLSLLVLNQRD